MKVEKPVKISNVLLDIDSIDSNADKNDRWMFWVREDGFNTLLANLSRKLSQVQIDVAFGKGESVEFFVVGQPANVYISGYYILTDDEYDSNTGQPEVKLETPFMMKKTGNADTSN